MRTDLKLNYGVLDAISERISAYHNAIDDMDQAMESLKGVLENQESEAVEKLMGKIGSTMTNLEGKKTTLKLLKDILDDYTADMETLVGAVNRDEQVRADQYDICVLFPCGRRTVILAAWGNRWISGWRQNCLRMAVLMWRTFIHRKRKDNLRFTF